MYKLQKQNIKNKFKNIIIYSIIVKKSKKICDSLLRRKKKGEQK